MSHVYNTWVNDQKLCFLPAPALHESSLCILYSLLDVGCVSVILCLYSSTSRGGCHCLQIIWMHAVCQASPGHISRVFSHLWQGLFSLSITALPPAFSISLIYVLTCGHFLIIPILISATVNEWRDSSCRVWAFGLMWALQQGSLGIVCVLSVHYCGYMTF